MSDALDRRDCLAEYSGERGSMVLVTERRKARGAMTCKVCNARNLGGPHVAWCSKNPVANPRLPWLLADGWSQSDHGQIAACPAH